MPDESLLSMRFLLSFSKTGLTSSSSAIRALIDGLSPDLRGVDLIKNRFAAIWKGPYLPVSCLNATLLRAGRVI